MLAAVTDTNCTVCGKALAANDVLYTSEAAVICVECSGKAEIAGDEQNSAKNIKRAAFTCLAAALLGFGSFMVMFSLGFWAGAIISVGAGLFAANSMLSNGERFLRYLSPADKTTIWVCTIAGLGIAAYETLAIFGVIRFQFVIR